MDITQNLVEIKKNIPSHVKLVAVSKFHPIEAIYEAYQAGQRVFGESRMQELKMKCNSNLPADIEWHFIGHLQSNKVKDIVPYVDTIHSVDSPKLIFEIEKHAASIKKEIKCLLEIHVADEENKYGFTFEKCSEFIADNEWKSCKFVHIAGLMCIASNTDDENKIRQEFRSLKNYFEDLKYNYFSKNDRFKEISMGMSHDYKIAIEEGSTIVRVGTSIFGAREYSK